MDKLYYKYAVLQLRSVRKYVKYLNVICHLFTISTNVILLLFEYRLCPGIVIQNSHNILATKDKISAFISLRYPVLN